MFTVLGYLFYELFGDVTMGLNFITTTDVLLGYLIILDTSSLQIVFDFLLGLDAPGCCWLRSIASFHREIVKEIAGAEFGLRVGWPSVAHPPVSAAAGLSPGVDERGEKGGGEAAAKAVGPLFRSAHPPIQQIKSIYKATRTNRGGRKKRK